MTLGVGDVRLPARQVMVNVTQALAGAGASPIYVLKTAIDVAGSGFLYNMVRIIAGTLVEIGRGRIEPEKMPEILAAKDRRAAGPTLPPTGLCLMWIRYAGCTQIPKTPASPA